jgi:hypothetical protein
LIKVLKEGKAMAVITMTQWARLLAKAWLEPEFKEQLEKDPAQALPADGDVRKDFGIRDEAKLFDLNDPSYGVSFGGGTDESGTEPAFRLLRQEDLQRIIAEGVVRIEKEGKDLQAKMMSSEWISYPPLYTQPVEHPDEPVEQAAAEQIERGLGSKTLTLRAWARIMAYMFLPGKEDLQKKFEKDPAATVDQIVKAINNEFKVSIHYARGQTALFRLGDKPKNISVAELNSDIRNNPNTYARVLVRITC